MSDLPIGAEAKIVIPDKKTKRYILHRGDCLRLLDDLPECSIDLLVTDPPYKLVGGGCSASSDKPTGGILSRERIEARKGILFEHNDISFDDWLPKIFRIMKNKTHAYIMVNSRNLQGLWLSAEKAGFAFQQLIVWKKNNATPSQYYMNNYEMILMLRKGSAKAIKNRGTKNILEVPNIIGNKTHPTEKPVNLMKILIENSSNAGDIVIDPFMGSGSTGVACANIGRNFVGIELDENYFNIAKQRIESAQNDPSTGD